MKKYNICFLLLLGVVLAGLLTGFYLNQGSQEPEPFETSAGQEEALPETEMETETVAEDRVVINQKKVRPAQEEKEQYLLVSEDGFLLVFGSHGKEICLYTHIPISDFPESEQDKLRQGIWFSLMEEVYSYLESYTS